jgi:hypothetical protein
MNCLNCGSELRPDARSCQRCGFEVGESSETPPPDRTPAASAVYRRSAPWPHLIALGALGALIALILAGNYVYQTNGSLLVESPAKSVSLRDSDLPPGMSRCTSAGWPEGKGSIPFGATDVWTVVYADSCNLPPSRRYAFTWVLEFESETAAVAAYQAFTGSPDCTIAHGCVDWGLGQNSNLNCGTTQGSSQSGTVSCLGTWQRNAFMVTFQGIMGSIDEAKKAVLNMDARAHQIPAPSRH